MVFGNCLLNPAHQFVEERLYSVALSEPKQNIPTQLRIQQRLDSFQFFADVACRGCRPQEYPLVFEYAIRMRHLLIRGSREGSMERYAMAAAEALAGTGRVRICTRLAPRLKPDCFLASMLAEG